MSMERSNVTFALRVAAIIRDERDRILVVREHIIGIEQWTLPGGALLLGESLVLALERQSPYN
ncbi:hypothetical protein WPS_35230 [Vulcanimicrobium alpinum]|uniref:Nudix hydrolase domain-containing protein n=1 Tax=Vulcanimicrobium alpinum TaxID=3016050 RepID=A0AAN2CBT5_UNVUL|nr:NUDIX hydrolase [Vulcanimicrobium alpinum]BDE08247.1 hypothetical protein WPS_35230 [Vulcanimicrobium alpinum]